MSAGDNYVYADIRRNPDVNNDDDKGPQSFLNLRFQQIVWVAKIGRTHLTGITYLWCYEDWAANQLADQHGVIQLAAGLLHYNNVRPETLLPNRDTFPIRVGPRCIKKPLRAIQKFGHSGVIIEHCDSYLLVRVPDDDANGCQSMPETLNYERPLNIVERTGNCPQFLCFAGVVCSGMLPTISRDWASPKTRQCHGSKNREFCSLF